MSPSRTRRAQAWVGAAVVWLAVLGTGCTVASVAGTPSAPVVTVATTSPNADAAGPPRLAVSAAGQSGPMGLGAYCWRFDDTTPPRCMDGGVVTTAQVLTAAKGDTLTVDGVPVDAYATEVTVFPRTGTASQQGANRLAWPAADGVPVSATLSGDRLTVQGTLPAGEHLLAVQLHLAAGEATYGVQVDVR